MRGLQAAHQRLDQDAVVSQAARVELQRGDDPRVMTLTPTGSGGRGLCVGQELSASGWEVPRAPGRGREVARGAHGEGVRANDRDQLVIEVRQGTSILRHVHHMNP
jgi:hypothetical protein